MSPHYLRAALWSLIALGAYLHRRGQKEKIGGIEIQVKRASPVLGTLDSIYKGQQLLLIFIVVVSLPPAIGGLIRFCINDHPINFLLRLFH